MEFTKFITGNLEICARINTGAQVPRHDLPMIMKTGIRSVIYPALADRIGRHPFPLQVVPFYTRVAEAEALIEIIAKGPEHHMPVTPALAQTIADSSITALQLARSIVEHVPNPDLEQQVIDVTRKNIDGALKTAQNNFPNAEAFT